MPDTNRTRILLLILAGALLIGGVNVWQNSQVAKQEEITAQMPSKFKKKPRKYPYDDAKQASDKFKVGAAQTIPTTTTLTGSTANPNAPVTPAMPAAPTEPTKIAATARTDAETTARKNAGRKDPFLGITGFKPYPTRNASLDEEGAPIKLTKSKQLLVPPPPPVVHTYATPSIPSAEIPEPPSRPMLSHKVKLVAILADRAVLKITDGRLRQDNKWPQTVTLGSGDKFESLEVVRVAPDSVTIEEDGERSVKTLERIR